MNWVPTSVSWYFFLISYLTSLCLGSSIRGNRNLQGGYENKQIQSFEKEEMEQDFEKEVVEEMGQNFEEEVDQSVDQMEHSFEEENEGVLKDEQNFEE